MEQKTTEIERQLALLTDETKYIVVRQYSGVTRNKVLWEVLSRPLLRQSALDWADFQRGIYPKSKVFLIQEVDEEALTIPTRGL